MRLLSTENETQDGVGHFRSRLHYYKGRVTKLGGGLLIKGIQSCETDIEKNLQGLSCWNIKNYQIFIQFGNWMLEVFIVIWIKLCHV